MRNFRRVTRVQAASLVVFFLLAFTHFVAAADDWSVPTRALAKKITEKLKPGQSVTLSLQNSSSLSTDDAAAVHKDLETELRAQGLHVKANGNRSAAASEENIPDIHVTLSENTQGLLWVAVVEKGEDREAVMQAVPRAAAARNSASLPAMLLRSQMLLTQETPILDFVLEETSAGSAKQLLVLEPARVAVYVLDQEQMRLAQAAALSPLDSPQRDLRGSLRIIQDSLWAIVAGQVCRGTLQDTLSLKCASTGRHPWNEQGGEIWPDLPAEMRRAASSYSVARIQVNGKEMEIHAGTDGLARLYKSDDPKGPVATFPGWGSELAGLKSGCGSGWQLLVTRTGDYTERDAVQAFEITDKKAVPVSPPIEFAGPVMALHMSETKDAGIAVVRNLETGQYEAHVLSLSCGH